MSRTLHALSWRERSVIQRSMHPIQRMVDTVMMDSYFLQGATNQSKVLYLKRSDIQTGVMLGKGSFSVVHEVKGFQQGLGIEHDGEGPVVPASSSSSSSVPSLLEGRFAIKHLRRTLVKDPRTFQAAAADLLLEAKYLAALEHPGIVKLHAVAAGGALAYGRGAHDSYFLVTDRLDCTLKEKILEWQVLQQLEQEEDILWEYLPISPAGSKEDNTVNPPLRERLLPQKVDIAHQLASVLEYMHDQRLINRDIKPANIGLTANGNVKLFDFGFCRELPCSGDIVGNNCEEEPEDLDNVLYHMSGKGSLLYLAPEVLSEGRYNEKVDVYSFAMVLYEVLTLRKPFHSISDIEVFQELICHHKARPPLDYLGIPLKLQDLLGHAWDQDVRKRWSMKMIHDQLAELLLALQVDGTLDSVPVKQSKPHPQKLFNNDCTKKLSSPQLLEMESPPSLASTDLESSGSSSSSSSEEEASTCNVQRVQITVEGMGALSTTMPISDLPGKWFCGALEFVPGA